MNTVATYPLDAQLMDPVIAVTEEMLSELPEWRRSLGLNLMNQYDSLAYLPNTLRLPCRITRLVVVSWGRATKRQKKQLELDEARH